MVEKVILEEWNRCGKELRNDEIMKYTILHISDLHKGKDCHFDDLLDSLLVDREEYVQKGIKSPEIIVVSGDLAEGAKGENAADVIRKQYEEVEQFLNRLTECFLNGDKRRVIIVPGNHDINREVSKQGMIRSVDSPKEDRMKMRLGDQKVRWSWDDMCFYHVNNEDVYNKRFELYVEFYNRFYNGIRSITANCEKESYCVDIEEYNISFALFNSCYHLDHLNYSGAICPSGLTAIGLQLRDLYKLGRLVVGVWHHNVSGLPTQNNYLDYRILQHMMKNHIQVGLFGHQHMSEIISEYKDLAMDKDMFLVSSGSLYGNGKEMPSGFSRQYNLIELDFEGSNVEIDVHVRRDVSINLYEIPSWQESVIGTSTKTEIKKEIKLAEPSFEDVLQAIDKRIRSNNDFENGCKQLLSLGLDKPRVRTYFDDYLSRIESPQVKIELIQKPTNNNEATMILSAAIEMGEKTLVQELLQLPIVAEVKDDVTLLYFKEEAENLLKYGKYPL